jgi:hypothetical protein
MKSTASNGMSDALAFPGRNADLMPELAKRVMAIDISASSLLILYPAFKQVEKEIQE